MKQRHGSVSAPVFRETGPGCTLGDWPSCRPPQNPQPGTAGHCKGRSGGPRVSVLGLHRGSGTTGKEPCLWGEAEEAVIGVVALGHPGARPKARSFFPPHLIIGPLQNLIFCVFLEVVNSFFLLPPPSLYPILCSSGSPVFPPSPSPVLKCALTGIIDVEVIADGVSSSGQSFSTKQHSKGPNH